MRDSLRLLLVALACAALPACGTNAPSDSTPPVFAGLATAQPGSASGQVNLTWAPATDDSGAVIYDIFQTNAGSGTENMGSPTYQSSSSTGFTVSGLNSANHYWFIVQAADGSGNVDGNMLEIEVIAP